MDKINIGIIGLGFVGGTMDKSFRTKISDYHLESKYNIIAYDKFKSTYDTKLRDCISANIIFTALPTLFDMKKKSYCNEPTYEVVDELNQMGFKGCIVIKSTVEPEFTNNLAKKYPSISFIHNPEFLTARTAYEDFHSQTHVVLGKHKNCNNYYYDIVKTLYTDLYPSAEISECNSCESECMKIYCNTFYAVKIQYFNELYALSQKLDTDYDKIVGLMIKNGWINPMHTKVPGPDGLLSYGGLCFTKDTMALCEFMKRNDSINGVLNATITERNIMRSDNDNLKH